MTTTDAVSAPTVMISSQQRNASSQLLVDPQLSAELNRIEASNLENEAAVTASFVDQHFSGLSLAPREAHRVRNELLALLQIIATKKARSSAFASSHNVVTGEVQKNHDDAAAAAGGGGGGTDDVTSTCRQNQDGDAELMFQAQLKSFTMDLDMLIQGAQRALHERLAGAAAATKND